mmetsp:Transcript_23498/g.26952  ORF Transcript_23498/g.26952 Transcript_23498/m.26952 type:complete len:207 (+) Transcript_23498:556-1176(+)
MLCNQGTIQQTHLSNKTPNKIKPRLKIHLSHLAQTADITSLKSEHKFLSSIQSHLRTKSLELISLSSFTAFLSPALSPIFSLISDLKALHQKYVLQPLVGKAVSKLSEIPASKPQPKECDRTFARMLGGQLQPKGFREARQIAIRQIVFRRKVRAGWKAKVKDAKGRGERKGRDGKEEKGDKEVKEEKEDIEDRFETYGPESFVDD